ncbi:hypothetical protein DM032_26040, partial [Salmonella enterica subsp. enterica serovar Teshie]|nr:hypothetical protein [Salmonella enterica subsp. enterica serovar Teshie]
MACLQVALHGGHRIAEQAVPPIRRSVYACSSAATAFDTQGSSVFDGFITIMKLNHITGDISMANLGSSLTRFSRAGHHTLKENMVPDRC